MPSILEKITALLAALTTLIVALSVSHELGYFTYIGGGFFQTFGTVSDYFTNAIIWMPAAVLTAVSWLNYDWIWKNLPTPKKKDWKSWILPAIIVGVPVLEFVFAEETIPTFNLMLFIYLWLLYADRILPIGNADIPLFAELRKLTKVAVPVCVALFTLGYASAKSDMHTFSGAYLIKVQNRDEPMLRIPLRNFDKGLLARDVGASRIEFIRWDNIETISKSDAGPTTPLSCLWFGLRCKTINSPL